MNILYVYIVYRSWMCSCLCVPLPVSTAAIMPELEFQFPHSENEGIGYVVTSSNPPPRTEKALSQRVCLRNRERWSLWQTGVSQYWMAPGSVWKAFVPSTPSGCVQAHPLSDLLYCFGPRLIFQFNFYYSLKIHTKLEVLYESNRVLTAFCLWKSQVFANSLQISKLNSFP